MDGWIDIWVDRWRDLKKEVYQWRKETVPYSRIPTNESQRNDRNRKSVFGNHSSNNYFW